MLNSSIIDKYNMGMCNQCMYFNPVINTFIINTFIKNYFENVERLLYNSYVYFAHFFCVSIDVSS